MVIDYHKMFIELANRYAELVAQQGAIETEIAKLAQIIQSTYNLLSPAQQSELAGIAETVAIPRGLKETVLMALKARRDEWLTPPEIRDYLESIGMEFGSTASALASITTTLKRLVPEQVSTKSLGNGQTAYRVKMSQPELLIPPFMKSILRVAKASSDFSPTLNPPDPLNQRGKKK